MKLKLLIIILLLGETQCATRKEKSARSIISTQNSDAIQKKYQSFVHPQLMDNSEKTDASTLTVSRFVILRMMMQSQIYGKMQFVTHNSPEYVEWRLCKNDKSLPCKTGTLITNELFLGELEGGSYTAYVKACVSQAKALDPQENCGLEVSAKWEQADMISKSSLTLKSIQEKQNRREDLALQLYEAIKKVPEYLEQCPQATPEQIREDLSTQFKNIISLGSTYINYGLEGVASEQRDHELAAILTSPKLDNKKTYDPNYKVDGLFLTNEHGIQIQISDFIQKNQSTFDTASVINPNLKFFIFSAYGIHAQADTNLSMQEYLTLSPRQKSIVHLMQIKSLQSIIPVEQLVKLATYEGINAIFRSEQDIDIGLELTESDRCAGLYAFKQKLQVIRSEVILLNAEILRLTKTL